MSRRGTIPVIGLVGGIGSGKSLLARMLGEERPVAVIDGDEAGHQVLTELSIKEQILQRFGQEVLTASGEIDRRVLGRIVFVQDDESKQERHDLEQIVHPRIRELLSEQILEAKNGGEVEAVILDAAVMLETGWYEICDAIVFVDTDEEIRRERVLRTRGWSEAEFRAREANQFSVKKKKSFADYVVDNSGPSSDAFEHFRSIYTQILEKT